MLNLVLAAVCGVVIGCLSGVLGVGGGTMMVPVFRLLFGMSALMCTGTSMFSMIFTSFGGSVSHIRNKTCIVPLGLLAGGCGAVASPVGVMLSAMSPTWMVMVAAAFVVGYSAFTMIRKGLALPKGASAEAKTKASARAAAPLEMPQLSRRQYAIGALAGFAGGLAGGYVGLGGGFLMVPIFLSGVGITMKHASGTSLLAVMIIAASAALAQGGLGNVEVGVGLAMAAGSVPAAMLSASYIKRIPERTLRLAFGCFLLALSVFLVVNEIMVGL